MKLRKLEPIVTYVLEKYPQTRKDDFALIYAVYRMIKPNEVIILKFSDIMLNYDHCRDGLPPFESVTRCRRKVFMKRPDLNPKEIERLRMEKEVEFVEYANS